MNNALKDYYTKMDENQIKSLPGMADEFAIPGEPNSKERWDWLVESGASNTLPAIFWSDDLHDIYDRIRDLRKQEQHPEFRVRYESQMQKEYMDLLKRDRDAILNAPMQDGWRLTKYQIRPDGNPEHGFSLTEKHYQSLHEDSEKAIHGQIKTSTGRLSVSKITRDELLSQLSQYILEIYPNQIDDLPPQHERVLYTLGETGIFGDLYFSVPNEEYSKSKVLKELDDFFKHVSPFYSVGISSESKATYDTLLEVFWRIDRINMANYSEFFKGTFEVFLGADNFRDVDVVIDRIDGAGITFNITAIRGIDPKLDITEEYVENQFAEIVEDVAQHAKEAKFVISTYRYNGEIYGGFAVKIDAMVILEMLPSKTFKSFSPAYAAKFDPQIAQQQILQTIRDKTNGWVSDANKVTFGIGKKGRDGYLYKIVVYYNNDLYDVELYRIYMGSDMERPDWGLPFVANRTLDGLDAEDIGEHISDLYEDRAKYKWEQQYSR